MNVKCEDCDHIWRIMAVQQNTSDCPKCRCIYFHQIDGGLSSTTTTTPAAAVKVERVASKNSSKMVRSKRRCEECAHEWVVSAPPNQLNYAIDCPECRCAYSEELPSAVEHQDVESSSSSDEEELIVSSRLGDLNLNSSRGSTGAPTPVDRSALVAALLEEEDDDSTGKRQKRVSKKLDITLSMCLQESMNSQVEEEHTQALTDDAKIREMLANIRSLTPNEELELELLLVRYGVDKYF